MTHSHSPSPFQVFQSGTHHDNKGRKLHIGLDALKKLVRHYSPNLSETPIVIGHPQNHHPAFGWIKKFSLQGDTLLAHPHRLDEGFTQAVKNGHYRKTSLSLYAPDHPQNPKPGTWYPRHIGFLGATPPAIKGLAAVEFSESDEQILTISHDFAETPDMADMADEVTNKPADKPTDKAPLENKADDKLYDLGKKPLRNLLKGLKLIFTTETPTIPADFFEAMVQSGDLLPAEQTQYVEICNEFLAKFSKADHAEQYQPILHDFLHKVLRMNKSSAQQSVQQPEFSEMTMPKSCTTQQSDAQDARLAGYQLGMAARQFLAQQRANGLAPTMMEAIQHAKEIRRIS